MCFRPGSGCSRRPVPSHSGSACWPCGGRRARGPGRRARTGRTARRARRDSRAAPPEQIRGPAREESDVADQRRREGARRPGRRAAQGLADRRGLRPWLVGGVQAAGKLGAGIAWRRQGPRVVILEANLRRVLGPEATGAQLRALSRESMRSYARYWLEVFRLPVTPVGKLVGGMQDTGHIRHAFEMVGSGRGVIFALPHMGNWDQAGAWFIASGAGSFTTVMERLKPDSLYDRFVAFREGLGMEVLPASRQTHVFGILAQRLRQGKIVCLPA